MKATVNHIVKKVTLELIYDVVDERTKELKDVMKQMKETMNSRFEQMKETMNSRFEQTRQEYKEDFKSLNGRIDQIHTRLDQMMHMLADLRK